MGYACDRYADSMASPNFLKGSANLERAPRCVQEAAPYVFRPTGTAENGNAHSSHVHCCLFDCSASYEHCQSQLDQIPAHPMVRRDLEVSVNDPQTRVNMPER